MKPLTPFFFSKSVFTQALVKQNSQMMLVYIISIYSTIKYKRKYFDKISIVLLMLHQKARKKEFDSRCLISLIIFILLPPSSLEQLSKPLLLQCCLWTLKQSTYSAGLETGMRRSVGRMKTEEKCQRCPNPDGSG